MQPRQVLRGTAVAVLGRGFRIGEAPPEVRVVGDGLDELLEATVDSERRLTLSGDELFDVLGRGRTEVELVVRYPDAAEARSDFVDLDLVDALEPRLDRVSFGGVLFLNDRLEVEGDGLLFGAGEGRTRALISGVFTPDEGAPLPVSAEVEVAPTIDLDRRRGTFLWKPRIAGIRPGLFEGEVVLANPSGPPSRPQPVLTRLERTTLTGVSTTAVSLGQYLDLTGFGFVADPLADETTIVRVLGEFQPTGKDPVPVDFNIVPASATGQVFRYVLDEADEVGQRIDLRKTQGVLRGMATPVVQAAGDRLEGSGAYFQIELRSVKQVVFVNFLPSYVASLRRFGLRAADFWVRRRVIDVAERDYRGLAVDFRTERPTDFFHYTQVDIAGPDPNGQGLLGYDNTQGKDTNNNRLYDRIGSVNAQTMAEGYPAYGGVFADSFLGFSEHPPADVKKIDGASTLFDDVFDRLREDQGGRPVSALDLADGPPEELADGYDCPGDPADRPRQIACGIFILGNLLGTTLSHELGHSLGLANPFGDGFHNPTDEVNRIMDAGQHRPFEERAELDGLGPAVFCDEEFEYLRDILPSDRPPPNVRRPGCF